MAAASITMAGETEDDARRFEAYQKLLQLANSYEDTIGTVPQMAVVGIESHGKSSLVQAYVGFPCTFIGGGTATRCPVEYTLIHDPTCEAPHVEYCMPHGQYEDIEPAQLETILGKHMKSLGSGFSSFPVRVRVHSRDCVNIVLLDLPGIIINPAEGKENDKRKVDQIIQMYASQPSNFLLLVEKAVPSANSEALPKEMKRLIQDIRPTWTKECLVIATMFDQQVKGGNLDSLELVKDFYKSSQHPNQPRKHYVSLLPKSPGADPVAHIRRQIDLEEDMVNEWIRRVSVNASPDEFFPTDFKNQIGLKNARASIQSKFYELISTAGVFSRIRQTLREKKVYYEKEVKRRKQLLDGVSSHGSLRTSVDNLCRSFLSGLHNIFQYTNAMRKSFDSKCMNFYEEIEARAKEKIEEDDPSPVPFEPEWKRKLISLCEDDELIKVEVVSKLLGSTQINRATMVFKYLVLGADHEDWSDPGLQKRVFGHLASTPTTKTNYDKGIRELVKGGLTENLTDSIYLKWYVDHVEWILRHHGNLMMEHVLNSGGYGDLKDSQVPLKMMQSYREGVNALMKNVKELFNQNSWVHSQYIAHMQVEELIEILKAIPTANHEGKRESSYPNSTPSYQTYPYPYITHPLPNAPFPSPSPPLSLPSPPIPPPPPPPGEEDEDADEFSDVGSSVDLTKRDSSQPNLPNKPNPASKPTPYAPPPFTSPPSSSVTPILPNGSMSSNPNSNGNFIPYNVQYQGEERKRQDMGRAGEGDWNGKDGYSPSPSPSHTGLSANVISKLCNRKFEGTPAFATPLMVSTLVRETYFFNLILLLRQMEFLVNSMVVLEMNGDVDRKELLDRSIYSVLRLDEEELDKLRDVNLEAIAETQKEEEELLEKLTIDHKIATEAITVLELPRSLDRKTKGFEI